MQTLAKSKVRRCLFGPVDHKALRQDLDTALAADKIEKNMKWNFDFDKDSPLEGKFNWKVVDLEQEYIPSFYTRGYPVKVRRNLCDTSVKSTSGNLSSLSVESCESETCVKLDKSLVENTESSQSSVKLCNKPEKKIIQTQISAFMPKRKRSRSDVTCSTVRSKAPRL